MAQPAEQQELVKTAIPISGAPRQTITIKGFQFSVPQPFVEGHVLRPIEAAVLNQTYCENIRNNFASAVTEALGESEKSQVPVDQTKLQADLDTYVLSYDFGIRRGPREPVDPIEKEAIVLVTPKIKAALKDKGIAWSDLSDDQRSAYITSALDKFPAFRQKAKKIVALRADLGEASVEAGELAS